MSRQVVQSGYGIPVVFRGPYQRGDGLGSVFKALYRLALPSIRAVTPIIKKAGKAVAKQALTSGVEIARDVSRGEDWRLASSKRVSEGLDELGARAGATLREMTGGKRPRMLTPKLAARMLHSRDFDTGQAALLRRRLPAKTRSRKPRAKPRDLSSEFVI